MQKSKNTQGMSRNKMIATVSLAVIVITMVASTSTAVLVYTTPTTEDDGWTEGDYEGSSEEQEEQAQEDWEDADRPGDEDNGDDSDNEDDTENQDDEETQICPDGSVLPVDQGCPQPELQICPDGSAVEADEACPLVVEDQSFITCFDGSSVATLAECPPTPESEIPDPAFAPGFHAESVPETPEPLPICDGSFQDCITTNGDFCEAGSGAHECEIDEPETETGLYPCVDGSQVSDPQYCESASKSEISLNELGGTASLAPGQVPLEDKPCLYDTSLPQCQPVNGKCPDEYGMNEDDQCFPLHSNGCPDDYHSHEDDESGECISNDISCESGYVMTVMTNGGDNCEQKQEISCVDLPFYMTCDTQKNKNNNQDKDNDKTKVIQKTTVIQSATATANANAVDVSNCRLDGSANGIQQKFDTPKYLACGLYADGQKAYSDGFVVGCTQIGNTHLICQSLIDSSILNTKTQPTQTQTATQPTQTQTATQPTQAIQPATVGG